MTSPAQNEDTPCAQFADLHLHSCFSDGTYAPEKLAEEARAHGLRAIALTDHDTVEGCAATAAACARHGIEFIAATELTTEVNGQEVHLIGYFVDIHNKELLEALSSFQRGRVQRIYEMVARLNDLGLPLKAEAVFQLANCRSPGRPHVGRALVQAGLCDDLDEAFERFLKRNRPAWVPKARVSASRAIGLIHRSGGLAVLAHPGLNHNDGLIAPLAQAGLDGLECFHTKHSTAARQHYLHLAEDSHLLVTGGSDCHGLSKGRPLIGTVKTPYEYVRRLKQALAQKNASADSSPTLRPTSSAS